ncbi:hypothetical protein WJ16_28250 [Burkholderia metallica]|nr:hypothetical protein WJ16_28250 [Burkholderia metallica]
MRHILILAAPPQYLLATDLLALPRERRRHLPLAYRASRHAQEFRQRLFVRTVLHIFHQRQQMHIKRIEGQRTAFPRLGRMLEQHKSRMALAAVNGMLADAISNDFPVGNRVHLALRIGLKMHATMPAPIVGDRIDAVITFELVYSVHHRIGVRPGRGRETGLGQKWRADNHDRYRVWLYLALGE